MSANLLVDLGNSCQMGLSIGIGGAGSGLVYPASGAIVGLSVNMRDSDTYCNLKLAGNAVFTSGQLRIAVQTAPSDTSGQFTDPTSGLEPGDRPGAFASGGILWINSGGVGGGVLGAAVSGQMVQSGWSAAQAFQRPGQFVRAIVLSGDFYAGPLTVEFISQLRTTGSGGGFSYQPGSGTVNV